MTSPGDLLDGRRLPELAADELARYGRHLLMPEVGREGQRRLKAGRVLVVGAGGLGSPALLYLAAAGVGTLGLVDFDRVETSNLHRQVLYGTSDVGRPKLDVVVERLTEINPHVHLVRHDVRLTADNALDVLEPYDLVLDGSDNFPTRYLVNDAAVLTGKPNVYGAIARFEGQVAVFWGARGPCYRCLFPEPPPPGMVPSCAEGGVLGVLPGVIGALQASEALKLLLGAGEPAIGRLLVFDALRLRWSQVRVAKSPDCPVCSDPPRQTGLIDYEAFCGLRDEAPTAAAARPATAEPEGGTEDEPELPFEISPRKARDWLDAERPAHAGLGRQPPHLLDVRTPVEHSIARLEGSTLLPLQELPARWGELDRDRTHLVYCHHGVRSAQAVGFLRSRGYRATSLEGGIEAWSTEIDPTVPRY